MKRILVPTTSSEDWQRRLAQPDLHWKEGYSAMTLARSWEAGGPRGFPPEVERALASADRPDWGNLSLLLAVPEYEVPLPGGRTPSQTDLLALARGDRGLAVVAVEGKVDETLGPTVGEKRRNASEGSRRRLDYLLDLLGLPLEIPGSIRYQLLHRTVSAILAAWEFHADSAVMLVHSFSPTGRWFDDYSRFAELFGKRPTIGTVDLLGERGGVQLYIGWCAGDLRHRGGEIATPPMEAADRSPAAGSSS